MPRALAIAILLAAGCTGPQPTQATTLVGENLVLAPGPAGAVRIGLDAANGSAEVRIEAGTGALITVCPLTSIDEPLAGLDACRSVASGVREGVGRSGMTAIAFYVSEREATVSLRVEYAEGSGAIEAHIPQIGPPAGTGACDDNACNPFFELTPTPAGDLGVAAEWTGGEATAVVLQGSVLARSLTATGVPYREAGRADGSSPLSVSASLTEGAEYAVAFRHRHALPSSGALRDVVLTMRWPTSS
ncbi:MAG TPA: hypothetical protein VGB83_02015 [Actinomycetota bacterium]